MRRLLFVLACIGTLGVAYFFRCRHLDAKRHPLGGFKCGACGATGADLEAMGFEGGGWVHPMRRTYGRDRREGVTVDTWVH